ncbi:acyltransferase [Intrasporangium sp.]|uniref:acyltransferase n=1 Tax=Intrasporangium sp. TaxID=1925024 RepID=UPI002F92F5D2
MATAVSSARHTWMDLLRGTAVLLVIAWHSMTVTEGLGVDVPDAITMANQALSPYRLPTLLVISGMLLPRSLTKPVAAYVRGKVRAILWPFLIWTLIMGLLRDRSSLLDPVTWVAGRDHLWFLSTLFVCYLAALALRRVPGWVVAVAAWACWFAFSPQVPGLANWIWFGAYFFLGASLSQAFERITRLPGTVVAGLAVAAAAGAVLAAARSGYQWGAPWLVISLVGVLLLMWSAPRAPRVAVVRALEAMGRSSIYYYLAHVAAILLVGRGLLAAGVESGWLAYLAAFAAGLLGSYALTRIPAARWLFLFARRIAHDPTQSRSTGWSDVSPLPRQPQQ